MLFSCKCISSLIKGKGGTGLHDEGAQDLLVRRQGVHALKTCAMDEMVEIRKSALDILAYMARTKPNVINIILEIEILEMALEYVKQYPNETIDNEVLISCLNLVSFVI